MPKEFVMRGNTPSGTHKVLNFSGYTPGYAYRLTEFQLFPSELGVACKLAASITAAKTAEDPTNQNFANEGLIGSATFKNDEDSEYGPFFSGVVNDTFLITQDLILAVIDNKTGSPMNVNWQCRFEKVKLSGGAEAVANFNQFSISDG